jgi:hypothetical protein
MWTGFENFERACPARLEGFWFRDGERKREAIGVEHDHVARMVSDWAAASVECAGVGVLVLLSFESDELTDRLLIVNEFLDLGGSGLIHLLGEVGK